MMRWAVVAALCVGGCAAEVARRPEGVAEVGDGRVVAATTRAVEAREWVWDGELEAWVCPPRGWGLDRVKASDRHVHKTWISPTGDTAYGVIRFKVPFPVSAELALWAFMREMKRTQGDSVLLEKRADDLLAADGDEGGIRFVAEGGIYKIRTSIMVRGFRGWCVYAGTLRGHADNAGEMAEAVASREGTGFGRGAATRASR